MSDAAPAPQFDRRVTDANMSALALRMQGLEGRVEVLEEQGRSVKRAVDELKPLAQELHDAVFGGVNGDFPGVAKMTREVHDAVFGEGGVKQVVEDIRDVVQMGKGVFRAADAFSRFIKRFWPLIAVVIAVYGWVQTGKWVWPSQ